MTDTRLFKPKLALVAAIAAMAAIPATAQANWDLGPSAPSNSQQSGHPGTGPCSAVCSAGDYITAPTGQLGLPRGLGVFRDPAPTGQPGVPRGLGVFRDPAPTGQAGVPRGLGVFRDPAPTGQPGVLSGVGVFRTPALVALHRAEAQKEQAVTANTTPDASFDWADAAIGAGIATTIALLMMVTSVAVRSRGQARLS